MYKPDQAKLSAKAQHCSAKLQQYAAGLPGVFITSEGVEE